MTLILLPTFRRAPTYQLPMSIRLAAGALSIRSWHETDAEADAGGDEAVGLFLDGRVVGGSGLHRRIGPGGLEIGSWVRVDVTRRGIASAASRVFTDHAFTLPDVERVEIHHDAANTASESVPRRLGFRLVGDEPREIKAPAETGVHRSWRFTREQWTGREST